MKKMFLVFTVALAFACFAEFAPVSAAVIKWVLPQNERLEMVRTAGVKYYVNKRLNTVYGERNIIDLTCVKEDAKGSNVKGVFSLFTRGVGQKVFALNETYNVDFTIAKNGRYTVPVKDYMPNLRHIPAFPDKDLKLNEEWESEGELIIDRFSKPFKLTFPVKYIVSELTKEKGINYAFVKYAYSIDSDMERQGVPSDFPKRVLGKNIGVLKWDLDQNKPVEFADIYHIMFAYGSSNANGITSEEYNMEIVTRNTAYKPVTVAEKTKAKDELTKEFSGNKGVTVDTDDRGIVLRLGDMLFDFDSANLRSETKQTVESIADVIKKRYPNREIIVEGHTDNKGAAAYNQRLSEQRAKAVAEFLQPKVGHDKLSYRGKGANSPIADNTTAEGRQQNRRVEVIIKLN